MNKKVMKNAFIKIPFDFSVPCNIKAFELYGLIILKSNANRIVVDPLKMNKSFFALLLNNERSAKSDNGFLLFPLHSTISNVVLGFANPNFRALFEKIIKLIFSF
jgi:hypothetical protein